MTGDIIVRLADGTYPLSSTFELIESATVHDSGTNGHNVLYVAAPGASPVLSGGTTISGWSLYDAGAGIYRAAVPSGFDTRQLYVNDVRGVRSRSNDGLGWVTTSTGFTTPSTYAHWKNVSDLEVVHLTGTWQMNRFPVDSVSGNSVTAQTYPWTNADSRGISWLENAYELLDQGGEWYLDKTGAVAGSGGRALYYKPRTGEDLATGTVIAPVRETLVRGVGTPSNPLHNVTFDGVEFAYSTWLAPSTDGYGDAQAGYYRTTPSVPWSKVPAAVTFTASADITFTNGRFEHLGSAGVNFEDGSHRNSVTESSFSDIAGNGINLGSQDHHPANADLFVVDNVVANNVITKVGADYYDSVGVWGGYTDGSIIEHNDIGNVPYTGISLGWGWGHPDVGGSLNYTTPTPAKDNLIQYNYVHDVMRLMNDGGGIYLQGDQPGTIVQRNYVAGTLGEPGLYPDEGSEHLLFTNNVLADVGEWISIWTSSIANNTIQNNYTNSSSSSNNGPNNIFSGNQTGLASWPAEAVTIMDEAGPGVTSSAAWPRASSYLPGWEPVNALDNNAATAWSSASVGVPSGAPQWIALSLGSVSNLTSVELVPRAGGYGFPSAFSIQYSADGSAWTNVPGQSYVAFPTPTTAAPLTFAFGAAVSAKYVRIYVTGFSPDDYGNYFAQLAQVSPRIDSPVAASASSSIVGWEPSRVVDGATGTQWSSQGPGGASGTPQWLSLDLGRDSVVSRVIVTPRDTATGVLCFPTQFKLQSSLDGTSWTDIPGQSYSAYAKPASGQAISFDLANSITARHVRLYMTGFSADDFGNYYAQIEEMVVH